MTPPTPEEVEARLAPLFSSAKDSWATPKAVYDALDAEFRFDFDPCPLNTDGTWEDGTKVSWAGKRVFCNPPYGPGIKGFLAKASEAKIAVYLLPSRTDTKWWHECAMKADEIRFLKGRLKFGDSKNSAPFPSVVLIYGISTALASAFERGRRQGREEGAKKADESARTRYLEGFNREAHTAEAIAQAIRALTKEGEGS